MVEEFVSRMFMLRDAAHTAHWATKSYAEHVALGDLYDGIPDRMDAFVEAYQGFYGLIGPVKPMPYSRDNIMKQVQDQAAWIEKNGEEISRGNDALENLLQDTKAALAVAYYKLKNLK
jgi:hypothetical protein